jgi:dTDP-glucose pyrophosphorylase/CBS domain-containing protein
MNDQKYRQRLIGENTEIIEALKKMDQTGFRSLLVARKNKFVGILSIGDIQRAIINDIPLNTCIGQILRKNPRIASEQTNKQNLREEMIKYRMEFMPIISANGNIDDIIFWEDVFASTINYSQQLDIPVVIMAGGKGSRLKPLTNILPKPLLPLGDKTMIEHIVDNFNAAGCQRFFISVNYKAKMIRDYFKDIDNSISNFTFLEETKPLGTAGSLHLLAGKINESFFITNCDILINDDYYEMLRYHQDSQNEMTIIVALKHYYIPYGIIESGARGRLIKIDEKPEYTFKINSGMYIMEPHLISEIPANQQIHITDLIATIHARKGKIGVFPVSEKSWTDIGEWSNYKQQLIP